jgi:hypothetical protein
MPDRDNKLGKAKNLGLLGSSSLSKGDRLSQGDLDDLHRFSLSGRSNLDVSLAKIEKGTDVDVEVYALKRSFNDVKRSIGNIDFRKLQRGDRNVNLILVGALKGKQTQNLFGNLDRGDYLVRVLQRKGNSPYQFKLVANSLDETSIVNVPPIASSVNAANVSISGGGSYNFTVTYGDDVAVDATSFGDGDVRVTGSNGFSQEARFIRVDSNDNGNSHTVTYQISAPGGTWNNADNGRYDIAVQGNQVSDTSGNFLTAQTLIGSFQAEITPRRTLQFSGGSFGAVRDYSFILETTASDINKDPLNGLFINSIRDFKFTFQYQDLLSDSDRPSTLDKTLVLGSATLISFRTFLPSGQYKDVYVAEFEDVENFSSTKLTFTIPSQDFNGNLLSFTDPNSLTPLEYFATKLGAIVNPQESLFGLTLNTKYIGSDRTIINSFFNGASLSSGGDRLKVIDS